MTTGLINSVAHRRTSSQVWLRERLEIFLLSLCVQGPVYFLLPFFRLGQWFKDRAPELTTALQETLERFLAAHSETTQPSKAMLPQEGQSGAEAAAPSHPGRDRPRRSLFSGPRCLTKGTVVATSLESAASMVPGICKPKSSPIVSMTFTNVLGTHPFKYGCVQMGGFFPG